MTELTKERIDFIEHLHEAFLMRKGYGALAFISVIDIMTLFNKYLNSCESQDLFINRYVRSF